VSNDSLRVLADESVFLNPPVSEIPSRPTPDFAAQKAIMALAVNYVAHTLPTLPNFMATRITQHFSDLPEMVEKSSGEAVARFYPLGTVGTPVAFRNGQESDDPAMLAASSVRGADKRDAKDAKLIKAATSGLASWGEFGPILGIVLVDAAKGKLGWLRWEQWESKPVAVFQFSVGSAVSHYTLQYWRDVNGQVIGSSYRLNSREEPKLIRQVAGYSGTLTVDPASGTILRIGIEASLRPEDDLKRAGMVVEYDAVKIGDTLYTCPTHSITTFASMQKVQSTPIEPMENVQETQLNDVKFTDYRRFGSESTLVVGEASGDSAGQPAEAAESASTVSAAPSPAPNASAPAGEVGTPAPAQEQVASADKSTLLAAPSGSASGPASNEGQEILVTAAEGLAGADTSHSSPEGSAGPSFTLKVTTRLVSVGLFATDKHGKPVTDLKEDEVELYDTGRREPLAAFNRAGMLVTHAPVPEPSLNTFTNAHSSEAQAPGLFILLLDESHLPFNDLNLARGEVLSFLQIAQPDARFALYSISEHGFRVIQDVTSDRALVQAKLTAWMPTAAGLSQAAALDQRNRQQFDTVRSPDDLAYVNGNETPIPDGMSTVDPKLRQMGDNPLRQVLISMIALAHHFAPIPGHKSMAWISGDSALLNWDDRAVGLDSKVENTGYAINHTREALNEAHISLYAIDASMVQVGGAGVDPSLYAPGVQLDPTASCNSKPGGCPSARAGDAGRLKEQMLQDTRAVQSSIRLLAESTGGRAISKGSDLKTTLAGIEQESAAMYELGFHPDTPADGQFHALQVKIPTRKDVRLRYRTSYLYSEESANPRQRIQQVVWSPQDADAISLTAEVAPAAESSSGNPTIKLRIAFPGLVLQQISDRWTGQLYIFVAERDDAAQKAEVSGDTLRLALKQATYESGMPGGIPYQRAIEANPKLSTVRVIVVDGNSGKMGSVTLPSSAFHP
jgi:VWFA-related protein